MPKNIDLKRKLGISHSFQISFAFEYPKTKFDKIFLLYILVANPTEDSMRLTAAPGVRVPEVKTVSADLLVSTSDQQNDLAQEQSYTIGKITFVVEPRFRSEGNETLGSVLVKLMQSEIDD